MLSWAVVRRQMLFGGGNTGQRSCKHGRGRGCNPPGPKDGTHRTQQLSQEVQCRNPSHCRPGLLIEGDTQPWYEEATNLGRTSVCGMLHLSSALQFQVSTPSAPIDASIKLITDQASWKQLGIGDGRSKFMKSDRSPYFYAVLTRIGMPRGAI